MTPTLSYREAVASIEKRGMMPDGPVDLTRMRNAFNRLKDFLDFDPEKVVLVTGTNGKGSVCATLEALLLHAKQSVGLYTSPHLTETTERFRVQGEDVSEADFCLAHQEVDQLTSDLGLSHFEVLTAMALWIFFNQKKVKWGIFEIGLGGLWDATNVIPHRTSVITSLSLDHQKFLGNTLPEIAINKFGIIWPGNRVVHTALPSAVMPIAERYKKEVPSRWRESESFTLECEPEASSEGNKGPSFFINTQWGRARLKLAGLRAAENTATALTVFETLGFAPAEHLEALLKVRWPGRMERLEAKGFSCPVYFSGDHNRAGIESLIELLQYYPRKHLYVVCGIGREKEAEAMLRRLFELKDASVYLTETPFKGRTLEEYGDFLNRSAGSDQKPQVLLEKIRKKVTSNDLVLVTGSLYLFGDVAKTLANPQ